MSHGNQDVTYWGLEPPEALTAWYAIDDSNRDNGCMQVIPGTHQGLREHGKSAREGNLLSVNQEVAVSNDEEKYGRRLCLESRRKSQFITGQLSTVVCPTGPHADVVA